MSKYYKSMTLEGSRADAAIDCMRDEKILEPRSLRQRLDGFIFGSPTDNSSVSVSGDNVTIYTQVEPHKRGNRFAAFEGGNGSAIVETPREGGLGDFAFAFTPPTITATGSIADEMRKKARACVLKAGGIAP